MSLKKILKESNQAKKVEGGIFIPIEVGDVILTGRFKNKKTKVKSIGINDHGMPTINGRNVTRFRFYKKKEDESE